MITIETNVESWKGQTISFLGKDLTFKTDGTIELNSEIALKLIDEFPGIIFKYGEVPQETKEEVDNPKLSAEIRELKETNKALEVKIDDQYEDINRKREELKQEKEKLNGVNTEFEKLKVDFDSKLEAKVKDAVIKERASNNDLIDSLKSEIDLFRTPLPDLRKLAEDCGKTADQVKTLKATALVDIILKASK